MTSIGYSNITKLLLQFQYPKVGHILDETATQNPHPSLPGKVVPEWGSGSNILIHNHIIVFLFFFFSGKRTTYQRESSSHDDKRKSKTSFGGFCSKANKHWADSFQLGLLLSSEEKLIDILFFTKWRVYHISKPVFVLRPT